MPATATNGATAVVTYADPIVSGGTAPVTVACVPPSGSTFSVGSTSVTCTATDAVRRSASCSFTVTVVAPAPRLGVHTILAFGDSITEGEVPVAGEFGTFNIRPTYVELPKSYPATLTALLAGRYAAQGATRLDALALLPNNVTDCTTGIKGTVILGAVIDTDGVVRMAQIYRSVPLLDDAAISAVCQWRFTPASVGQNPTAVQMTVTVEFPPRNH